MLAGGLIVEPGGDAGGGVWEGALPVVVPGPVLARGVTSRMPGGAAGGIVGAAFWAVVGAGFWAVEGVPVCCIDELFNA